MKPLRWRRMPDGEIAIVITPETQQDYRAVMDYMIDDPECEGVKRLILGTAPSSESVSADAQHATARAHVSPFRGRA